jgi:hypothetical protein
MPVLCTSEFPDPFRHISMRFMKELETKLCMYYADGQEAQLGDHQKGVGHLKRYLSWPIVVLCLFPSTTIYFPEFQNCTHGRPDVLIVL